MRKAGELLNWFINDPVGEEVGEGTLGGLMAGAAQLGSDQPLAQTALQTAAAIAGGIGMGMLGRRIGARAGRHFHGDPLADQHGTLASMARVAGSETTMGGLANQGVMTKELIQEHLTRSTADKLIEQAVTNPRGFAAKYGMDADTFKTAAQQSPALRGMAAAMRQAEGLPPAERKAYLDRIVRSVPGLDDALAANRVIAEQTASGIDDHIRTVAQALDDAGGMEGVLSRVGKDMDLDALDPKERERLAGAIGMMQSATKGITPESLLGMLNPAPKVTGEHVGRMVGRFIGDEVGILGGLMTGNLLSQALGLTKEDELKPQAPAPGSRPPMP